MSKRYYYKIKEGRRVSNYWSLTNIDLVYSSSPINFSNKRIIYVCLSKGSSSGSYSGRRVSEGEVMMVYPNCLVEANLFNPSEGFTFFTHQKS